MRTAFACGVLLSLVFVPTTVQAESGGYFRHLVITGEVMLGPLCFSVGISPEVCVPGEAAFSYESTETQTCEGQYSHQSSINVEGLPFGGGVNRVGTWMGAYVGPFDASGPYILQGTDVGPGTIDLSGDIPTDQGHMSFHGEGTVVITTDTSPADCDVLGVVVCVLALRDDCLET